MRVREIIAALITGFLLWSCGSETQTPIDPPPTVEAGKKFQVYLFSAPWCEPCIKELKELQPLWESQGTGTRDRVSIKLFVQEGIVQGKQPTSESTLAFRDSLGLTFETISDTWKWKTYRSFFKNTWNLPAAVVLDEGGNKVKAFVGPPKFTPHELVDYINELLKGNS